MKVKGNRIEVGEWFIWIRPTNDVYGDMPDIVFQVSNKKELVSWNFDTLEEAWEKVNERV